MNLRMRWAIIILVIGGALYFMFPLNEKVRLGLDLQGGMHVVLGVDTEKAVEARLDSIVFQVRRELQQDGIIFSYVQKALPHSVNVGIEDNANNRRITDMMALYAMRADGAGGGELRFTMESQEVDRIRQNAVLQSLEVVRNRIDAFGVAEPVIQRQGREQVLVQLPGITDPDRAINLIGQTAQLKFYLVDETVTMDMLDMGNVPYSSMILYERVLDKNTGRVLSSSPVAVKREVILTGDSLMDAGVQYGQFNEPTVWFRFDPAGARIFEDVTSNNVGRRLAIVLDDNVYSAPNIRERIPGGNGTISGSFTLQQAQDLAIVLRAGSLPAPVTILENRTVGPSLGADSIASGVKASLIGFLAIFIFMVIYYRVSGFVANIGLVCNLAVLMGVMSLLGATLTLPGIAGIILALAIAVDANVLIFERVREELRNGRTVMNAFELGYQKAFNTIVDANVTSLIASVVLFQFGTGPVKGFAVTLSVGLIASMFTAVFVTKTIFMTFIIRNDPKKISI